MIKFENTENEKSQLNKLELFRMDVRCKCINFIRKSEPVLYFSRNKQPL